MIKAEQAYEKLQQLRSLERHEGHRNSEKRPKSYSELSASLKEEMQDYSHITEEKGETDKELKERIEEIASKRETKNFQTAREELEKEILQIATPEDVNKLKGYSRKMLWKFFQSRQRENKRIRHIQDKLKKYEDEVVSYPLKYSSSDIFSLRNEAKNFIKKIKDYLENKLPLESPEAFYAHYLLKLREYKTQLPTGIVETDYVKEQKQRIKEVLFKNRITALLGETGTGKTKIARKVAQELTGDYEFVPGHRFMTKEDLFSYLGIGAERIKAEDVPAKIKEAIKKYYEKNPESKNYPNEEKQKIEAQIEEIIIRQGSNTEMVTKVFESGVLKAAKEGRTVIIDEFNYIPSALLAGCNALIEANPGEKVNIFGQEVEVKRGFGVILTGNITKSEFQGKYIQREKIDPALINRLNSGLIEYSSLPQDTEVSFTESILKADDIKHGEETPKRELFEIALTILSDKEGNLSGPKDILEKSWVLSREFSFLQKIYAGEEVSETVDLPNGAKYTFKEYPISNRTFLSVIDGWRKDGFSHKIEWYLYDNLLRPASVVSPSEAGQMLLLFREKAGLFKEEEWNVLNIDAATQFKISGIEKIEKNRGKFKEKVKEKHQTHYFTPKEVAEALSGRSAPELKTENVEKEKFDKEKMDRYQELHKRYEGVKDFIINFEENVGLYCQDEKEILG